jgi:hypothetical protein
MTMAWEGAPAEQSIPTPTFETEMTEEQRRMLSVWWSTSGKATPDMLAGNLIRRFNLAKGKAWILAVRFVNEKRDNG